MWLLFPCTFSQHKMQAPSIRHGVCSTAHQRRLAELPQLHQNEPQVVHRDERHAVLGAQLPLCGLQVSAPQRLGLGEGAALHQHRGEPQAWIATGAPRFHGSVEERGHFFNYLWCRGIFLDPSPWWENEILGLELFWFHLSSCHRLYFIDAIFDACCKCCCLLQSTAFTFAALRHFWMQISGDKTIQFLTQQ